MLPILPLTQEPSKPVVLKQQYAQFNPQTSSSRRDSTFLILTEEPTSLTLPHLRPQNFLQLAPVHSDNYTIRHSRRSTNTSISSSSAILPSPQTSPVILPTEANAVTSVRRSTSVSSTSSEGKLRTFLRLAPVHDGEEDDDECAIEE